MLPSDGESAGVGQGGDVREGVDYLKDLLLCQVLNTTIITSANSHDPIYLGGCTN